MLTTIVVSICIILLCHYLWNYMLDTFSSKKTKDLVNGQMEKYKKMMGLIQTSDSKSTSSSTHDTEYMNKIDKESMNNELEQFISQELQTKVENI